MCRGPGVQKTRPAILILPVTRVYFNLIRTIDWACSAGLSTSPARGQRGPEIGHGRCIGIRLGLAFWCAEELRGDESGGGDVGKLWFE